MRGFFLLKIVPIAVEIHLWIINELRFQRNIQWGVTHTVFQSSHDFWRCLIWATRSEMKASCLLCPCSCLIETSTSLRAEHQSCHAWLLNSSHGLAWSHINGCNVGDVISCFGRGILEPARSNWGFSYICPPAFYRDGVGEICLSFTKPRYLGKLLCSNDSCWVVFNFCAVCSGLGGLRFKIVGQKKSDWLWRMICETQHHKIWLLYQLWFVCTSIFFFYFTD